MGMRQILGVATGKAIVKATGRAMGKLGRPLAGAWARSWGYGFER